jgi:hypothetical protein
MVGKMKAKAEFGILIFPISKEEAGQRPLGESRTLRIRLKDLVEMFVLKDRRALKEKYSLTDGDVKKMLIRLKEGRWRMA